MPTCTSTTMLGVTLLDKRLAWTDQQSCLWARGLFLSTASESAHSQAAMLQKLAMLTKDSWQ